MRATSFALLLLVIQWSSTAVATEEPAFRLVDRDGQFELRDYGPLTIAETLVREDFDEAGNSAFGTLFGYISGRNQAKQKIAMTAPVRQQAEPDGGFRVGFIVPAGIPHDAAPRPSNPGVQLRQVPAQRMAVLRYSGRWTEKNFREHETRLLEWMAGRKLDAAGPAVYARYNAPFVPWPMRRNEVMIPVVAAATLGR